MHDKIAHVLVETRLHNRYFGVNYGSGSIAFDGIRETARRIRQLESEGYEIIYQNVPFAKFITVSEQHKYRELNKKDRILIEKTKAQLFFEEKYPDLNPKLYVSIKILEKKGVQQGTLLVSDPSLYSQEYKKSRKMIAEEMREQDSHLPIYFLAADGEQVFGCYGIIQFTNYLRHFNENLKLRNSADKELEKFEGGRPLNEEEVQHLLLEGITLTE